MLYKRVKWVNGGLVSWTRLGRGVAPGRHPLRAVLAVLLLVPLVWMAPPPQSAPRAQALLLEMAAQRPTATVSVIVQKAAGMRGPEDLVARLGGAVTKDLRIINAFAAELPAGSVRELARAHGVRWVSLDAPMVDTTCLLPCIDTSRLLSAYPQAIRATRVWNTNSYLQGQGIGVAVVDSGVHSTHLDLNTPLGPSRVVASVETNGSTNNTLDWYGHGTHVAGIIGGNGTSSLGAYIGVAPKVSLINVKVSSDQGSVTASDVVDGLQWVLDNKDTYNIRVVNLSLNSSVMQSYHVDPLDAAVEVLWFNRIVVVVAAGNQGRNALYPPANDPFVITVGAADDRGTPETRDDLVASYSAYGRTSDGFDKPDLVAPGTNVVSLLASPSALLPVAHPTHLVSGVTGSQFYFRMSGTSMAAPVVAGGVALLLQDEPHLNPDQVKYRLMSTAQSISGAGSGRAAGAGMLNIQSAIGSNATQTANTGIQASQLLWTGDEPVQWESLNWNSLNWNSLNWNSVDWNSLNWNSLNWNSDVWDR